MSVLRPSEFGGRWGWEILSDIARHYASQDIKVARVLITVTKYLKTLEASPTLSVEGKLEGIKLELTSLVEMLGTSADAEVVEGLKEALAQAETQKRAIFEEFAGDAQELKDATEELEAYAEAEGQLNEKVEALRQELAESIEKASSMAKTFEDAETAWVAENTDLQAQLASVPTKRAAHTETVRLLQVELADLAGEKEALKVKLAKRTEKYGELLAAYKGLKEKADARC